MITIYNHNEENFATLGLGALRPTECDVDWEEGGRYDLTMKHPIHDDGKWLMLQTDRIIRAPSPVRESPQVEITAGESTTTTISREIYKVKTPRGGRLNLRKGPSTGTKVLASYKPETLVVKTGTSGEWTKVLILNGGRTGWMYTEYLAYVRTESETVATGDKPGVIIKRAKAADQLFRINVAEPDIANGIVNVEAEHISYDLKWVKVIGKCELKNVPVATALAKVQSLASREHDFEIHCMVSGNVSGDYTNKSLLECIRDPEIGFAPQLKARVVCDNFDIWILPDEVRDMGVELRYRKNLKGVRFKSNSANQISRIYPVGKDKNGDPLYLDGVKYVESEWADYLVGRDAVNEYDVKVGNGAGEFKDNKAARAELARLAQADMDAGADMATFSMDVSFLDLGDTEEYKQYRGLMIIHPYDTVSVIHGDFGKKEKARLNKCRWNCILKQYKSTTLGDVQTSEAKVYSFNIAAGAVGGGKIAAGAVDTAQLRNLSIQYAKIAQAAIEQLSADAITAVRAHIHDLTAGNITTDQLYADFAKIASLEVAKATFDYANIKELDVGVINALVGKFEEIAAGELIADELYASFAEVINLAAKNLEADSLSAALGNFVTMYAGTGEFDFATIQNLVAKAMALEQGSMDTVYIKNLSVTTANMLSATLGKLVIKGDDGKYYRVFVSATGEISTEEVAVSDSEITTGQTSGGQQIVETNLNVGNLSSVTVQADSAVINSILTIALNAEKITAADALIASATIPALYTTSIKAIGDHLDLSANESVQIMVGKTARVFRSEDAPQGAKVNDLWVQTSTGFVYQCVGDADVLPGFYTDDDGNLYYRYADDQAAYGLAMDEDGNLYIDAEAGSGVSINEDGKLSAWVQVRDSGLEEAISDTESGLEAMIEGSVSELNQRTDSLEFAVSKKVDGDELRTYMRYEDGTLELGRSDSRYTTRTSDNGFSVLQDGEVMASMEQNTVSAPVINARRKFTLGEHSIYVGATGHLIFN